MAINNSILHSSLDYDIKCSEKSIELFLSAAQNPKYLPGRLNHISITVVALIKDQASIYYRIAKFAVNILLLAATPFTQPGWNEFCYRVIRLAVLDPLDILAGKVILIVHVASSVLGILSPEIACRGWMLAEHIEMCNVNLDASLWKSFVNANTGAPTYRKEINPFNAEWYFGRDNCHTIQFYSITDARRAELTKEVDTALAAYIDHVASTNDFDKCFSVDPNMPQRNDVILRKANISKPSALGSLFTDSTATKLSHLTNAEKYRLYEHMTLKASTLPKEKADLQDKALEKLAEVYQYGSVRYYT